MLFFVALFANAQPVAKKVPALKGKTTMIRDIQPTMPKEVRESLVAAGLEDIDEWTEDGEVDDDIDIEDGDEEGDEEGGEDSEIIIQEYSLEDMTLMEFRYYPDDELEAEGKYNFVVYLYPDRFDYPCLMLDLYTTAPDKFEGTYSVKAGNLNLKYSGLEVEAQYPGDGEDDWDDDWDDDDSDWSDEDDPTQAAPAKKRIARAAQAYFDSYWFDLDDAAITIKKNNDGTYTANTTITYSDKETAQNLVVTAEPSITNSRYLGEPTAAQEDINLTMTNYEYYDDVAELELATIYLSDDEKNHLALPLAVKASTGKLDRIPEGTYQINDLYYNYFCSGYVAYYLGYQYPDGTYLYKADEEAFYFLQEATIAISYSDGNTITINVSGTSFYGTKVMVNYIGEIPSALDNTLQNADKAAKVFQNGQLLIRRGEKTYNLQGLLVK